MASPEPKRREINHKEHIEKIVGQPYVAARSGCRRGEDLTIKGVTNRGLTTKDAKSTKFKSINISHAIETDASSGASEHAAVRCGADQRKQLEHLCRYITRPAIANERLKCNRAGQVVLQLKSAY